MTITSFAVILINVAKHRKEMHKFHSEQLKKFFLILLSNVYAYKCFGLLRVDFNGESLGFQCGGPVCSPTWQSTSFLQDL